MSQLSLDTILSRLLPGDITFLLGGEKAVEGCEQAGRVRRPLQVEGGEAGLEFGGVGAGESAATDHDPAQAQQERALYHQLRVDVIRNIEGIVRALAAHGFQSREAPFDLIEALVVLRRQLVQSLHDSHELVENFAVGDLAHSGSLVVRRRLGAILCEILANCESAPAAEETAA